MPRSCSSRFANPVVTACTLRFRSMLQHDVCVRSPQCQVHINNEQPSVAWLLIIVVETTRRFEDELLSQALLHTRQCHGSPQVCSRCRIHQQMAVSSKQRHCLNALAPVHCTAVAVVQIQTLHNSGSATGTGRALQECKRSQRRTRLRK